MSAMLALAVSVHSLLRWVVLVLGALAVMRAVMGRASGRPWTPVDARAGLLFSLALGLQFFVGLVLFVKSPITVMGIHELGVTMTSRVLRFFTIEHPLMMLAAIAMVNVGRARTRRAANDAQRHRTALVFFGLGLLLIVAGIPWPFLPYGRPWMSWP